MTVKVTIPPTLVALNGGSAKLELTAGTVGELLGVLKQRNQELHDRMCLANGSPRPFVRVFVNKSDIRMLQELATVLASGDEVVLMMALAGG